MNEKLGPIYVRDANETDGFDKPFSKALDNIIDFEVRNIIATAYQKTEQILKDNRGKLDKVVPTIRMQDISVIYYLNIFQSACYGFIAKRDFKLR